MFRTMKPKAHFLVLVCLFTVVTLGSDLQETGLRDALAEIQLTNAPASRKVTSVSAKDTLGFDETPYSALSLRNFDLAFFSWNEIRRGLPSWAVAADSHSAKSNRSIQDRLLDISTQQRRDRGAGNSFSDSTWSAVHSGKITEEVGLDGSALANLRTDGVYVGYLMAFDDMEIFQFLRFTRNGEVFVRMLGYTVGGTPFSIGLRNQKGTSAIPGDDDRSFKLVDLSPTEIGWLDRGGIGRTIEGAEASSENRYRCVVEPRTSRRSIVCYGEHSLRPDNPSTIVYRFIPFS